MNIEKLKYEAQNKALHIADVSGSALFNADCNVFEKQKYQNGTELK